MANHQSLRTLGVLSVFSAAGMAGCHHTTMCEPTSAALGQIVTSGVSESYLAQVDKTGADVPHLACKAEANIATTKLFLRESEDANCDSTGKNCLGPPNLASHMVAPRTNVHTTQGEFRVLGLGKGIAIEDCGRTAISACNAGIDAYYQQQRAVRPPTIECRLADYQAACEPGGRQPRVARAAPPREPEPSPEDRLPATWIARLGDAKSRPVAIRALMHFHSDAMMRANQNAADPAVKGVLDQIVEPLTKVYVEANLERGSRILLIKFLADSRDPRAGRAWIHACHGFATAAGPDEEDVYHASRAIGATKHDEAAPALGEAFAKLEAGTPKGTAASKSVYGAMVQLKSAAWKPMLLEKLGRSMERPRSSDASQTEMYQSQLFWQQTSADVLGTLGDASATKPLLKVLMEKDKAEVAGAALLGLVKIGANAVPILVEVLAGKDTEMVEFAKSKSADSGGNAKSYVSASATALGAIGRVDARAPMIQALKSADNDMNRAVVARELTTLPANADSIKAFQGGYDKVPFSASIWPSMFAARPALLTASARFYDGEVVPWLLNQANAAKGKDEETLSAALTSAIKLMKGPNVVKVKVVVEKIGAEREKSAFQAASDLLGKCAEDVDCYIAKLKDDDASGGFVGIKAAHMVGMLGDTRAGMELVKLLPSVRNTDVRAAAVLAIDHAVQKDTASVADALQKLIDDKSSETPGAWASTPAEQVVYRLRAR
jgi:HEAT repeat protein